MSGISLKELMDIEKRNRALQNLMSTLEKFGIIKVDTYLATMNGRIYSVAYRD